MITTIPKNCLRDNILYFTITNFGYISFVKNFSLRLQQLNIAEKFIVICTDKESYNELSLDEQLHCIFYPCVVPKTFESWKTVNYKEIVFSKLDITRLVLEYANTQNINSVVYMDTDIWMFRDFHKDLQSLIKKTNKHFDILMQDGEDYKECPVEPYFKTTSNDVLIKRYCTRLCTGFMVLKPIPEVINIFNYKTNYAVNWNKYVGNQPYLNDVINAYQIKAFSLPRNLLLNGSIFSNEECDEEDLITLEIIKNSVSTNTWLLHYTYTEGVNKVKRMMQAQHWLLTDNLNSFNIIRGGKPELFVCCGDGFANQLRLSLAGSFLVQANCIASFTQEWTLSNHNNVDYTEFFKPLPQINYQSVKNVDPERVITSSSFEELIKKYGGNKFQWPVAFQIASKYIIPQLHISEYVEDFIKKNNIANAIGLHVRRTCKTKLLEISQKRGTPLSNNEMLNVCHNFPKVFLATDNSETQNWFKERLLEKLVTIEDIANSSEEWETSYNPELVKRHTTPLHTVLDFLILKRCKTFQGSNESSYSLLLHQWRKTQHDFHVFGKV